jgi:phosphatidate cytidylyltransferase
LAITTVVIALLMMWEFQQMTLGPGEHYAKSIGLALAAALAAVLVGWVDVTLGGLLLPVGTMLVLVAMVARPEPHAQALRRASMIALGCLYSAGLVTYLFRLRESSPSLGLGLALAAIFCTWGSDTGAYFAGRFLGRHKLYPKVSPSKTVEGGIGGVLSAVGVAFLVRLWFAPTLGVFDTVAMGLLAGVVGQCGDLAESLLKRSVGAKDSSKLIPGHGGVLDRFDGVMFVAPTLYAYAAVMLR